MLESTSVEPSSLGSVDERAALLAVVADPIRLEVLIRLAAEGTKCVCDLQTDPPVPANQLSYHLKVLRDSGLVSASRRGRWMDYRLTADALDRLHTALPRSQSVPRPSECCGSWVDPS